MKPNDQYAEDDLHDPRVLPLVHRENNTEEAILRYNSFLSYFKAFSTPRWILLPEDAITFFALPLLIGKNRKRLYKMPAICELTSSWGFLKIMNFRHLKLIQTVIIKSIKIPR